MLCLLRLDRVSNRNSQAVDLFGRHNERSGIVVFNTCAFIFSAQPLVFLMPLCQTAILLTLLLFTGTLTLLSHSRKRNMKTHIKEIPLSIFPVQIQH